MQNEIEKFIKAYQERISQKEKELSSINHNIDKIRETHRGKNILIELRAERVMKEAQNQAYVQALRDFESLLKYKIKEA